jgi:putative endonuclease
MFYVYVLRSLKDSKFYVGYTANLQSRIAVHEEGKVLSTRARLPLELVYYEASRIESDALRREKYLKSTYGKRYIRNRIRDYLHGK